MQQVVGITQYSAMYQMLRFPLVWATEQLDSSAISVAVKTAPTETKTLSWLESVETRARLYIKETTTKKK